MDIRAAATSVFGFILLAMASGLISANVAFGHCAFAERPDIRFDADRHSVPEHRLGVLKRRIGDNCRSERRSATF